MFENVGEPSIMVPRPDSNTSEAILYGDEYQFYKSAMWWWDAVRNELEKQLEAEKAKLRDPEFCLYVLERHPGMIWSKQPPVNEIERLRDIRQLREVIRRGTAIRNLEVRRANNEMYAKLKGIDKHVKEVRENGVSETMWMAATSGRNQQIDFEMLREILDDDRLRAEADAREIELTIAERRRENERFQKEYDEYMRMKEEQMDPNRAMESADAPPDTPEKKPFSIDDVSIFREAGETPGKGPVPPAVEGPESDEYWGTGGCSEGDVPEDVPEDVTAPVTDWIIAPVHERVRRDLREMYMDDMGWFLNMMEVHA